MPRSDTSLAALLLTQRLVDTDAPPLKASEYWAVLDTVEDPAKLLGRDAASVAATLHADIELSTRIVTLLDAATAVAFSLDDTAQAGLRVVASVDPEYPVVLRERLGPTAPPLLYVAGEPALLARDLLGVVGSRHVAPQAAEVAQAAAVQAAERGTGVVSGGAKGADRLAMWAALEGGGFAVGVLAESLERAVREPEVRHAVADGRLCLCTPYKPSAGFSVANAMGRNKVVYALSRATLVVAADHDKGGTWAGAVEALRQAVAPVLVWTGAGCGDGNAELVRLGGIPVDDVDGLFPLPSPVARADRPSARQLSLGM